MNIKDMNNEELVRNYSTLLIEIENKYQIKKEFEQEFKERLRRGELNGRN